MGIWLFTNVTYRANIICWSRQNYSCWCHCSTKRRAKVARLRFVTMRFESKQCCLAWVFSQVQISRSVPVLQPTEYCAKYKTTIFEPINIFGKVWRRVENWVWKLLLAGQWICPNSAFFCFQKVPTKTSLMCGWIFSCKSTFQSEALVI